MYSTQLGRRISSQALHLSPVNGMRNNVLKNCYFPTHARLAGDGSVALCRTHFQLNLRGKCWNCCLAVIRAQSWRGRGWWHSGDGEENNADGCGGHTSLETESKKTQKCRAQSVTVCWEKAQIELKESIERAETDLIWNWERLDV